ncbi:hypothetical protein ACFWA9_04730 [Kitasatospora sp. NPDC059973]|uniref:hypothetical protein n=1 Tax=Kitasatospora sp. NPDC059973 TaxID=3347020 RepID=UPI0036A2A5B9
MLKRSKGGRPWGEVRAETPEGKALVVFLRGLVDASPLTVSQVAEGVGYSSSRTSALLSGNPLPMSSFVTAVVRVTVPEPRARAARQTEAAQLLERANNPSSVRTVGVRPHDDAALQVALITAEAEKQATILRAEGEAQAAVIRADGEASARRTLWEAEQALQPPMASQPWAVPPEDQPDWTEYADEVAKDSRAPTTQDREDPTTLATAVVRAAYEAYTAWVELDDHDADFAVDPFAPAEEVEFEAICDPELGRRRVYRYTLLELQLTLKALAPYQLIFMSRYPTQEELASVTEKAQQFRSQCSD